MNKKGSIAEPSLSHMIQQTPQQGDSCGQKRCYVEFMASLLARIPVKTYGFQEHGHTLCDKKYTIFESQILAFSGPRGNVAPDYEILSL